MKDQANELKLVSCIRAQTVTNSDVTGADIDRTGFESVTYSIDVGAEGDTLSGSVKIDFLMYESDSASPASSGALVDASDIIVPADQSVVLTGASGLVLTIDAAAEAPVNVKIGYKGGKKFTTIKADQTGQTNGTPVSVIAILGNPATQPVAA